MRTQFAKCLLIVAQIFFTATVFAEDIFTTTVLPEDIFATTVFAEDTIKQMETIPMLVTTETMKRIEKAAEKYGIEEVKMITAKVKSITKSKETNEIEIVFDPPVEGLSRWGSIEKTTIEKDTIDTSEIELIMGLPGDTKEVGIFFGKSKWSDSNNIIALEKIQ